MCTVLNATSSKIDQVLSINLSANVFVFGEFNFHHNDLFIFSGGTDKLGEKLYNLFEISNAFTQMVNFPTRNSDSHSPALFALSLLTVVFVLQQLL